MRDYLLDTNAISALLNHYEKVVTKVNEATDEGGEIFLSVISDYEINRGLFAANATRKLEDYKMLRQQYHLVWIDSLELSKKAAEIHADLKKKGTPIQDADILIAATALLHNLTVVTDDQHFWRISELKVENWLRG